MADPVTREYPSPHGGPGYVDLTPTPYGLVVSAMDDVGAYGTENITVPWEDVRAMLAEAGQA